MVDALFPTDVDVTINGSTFTTKIYSYEESGGTKNVGHRKTLLRKHKRVVTNPSDWRVVFQGTVTGSSFEDLWKEDDTYDISLDFNSGSNTITYSNITMDSANHTMEADDRLNISIEFSTPFYDNNGSENRVVQ